MPWAFISGLLVAFAGAFFAHLFVAYRNEQEQYQELIAVLSQIAELEKDQLREAGQAAKQAQEQGVRNAEVAHPGNRVWRLRERMHEAVDPVYHELTTDCKDSIDRIDEWILKLNDGGALAHINQQWVAGEAGAALDEIPSITFAHFLKHYFAGSKPSYRDTMERKAEQQAEIKDALETRREQLEDTGYYDEKEPEPDEQNNESDHSQ